MLSHNLAAAVRSGSCWIPCRIEPPRRHVDPVFTPPPRYDAAWLSGCRQSASLSTRLSLPLLVSVCATPPWFTWSVYQPFYLYIHIYLEPFSILHSCFILFFLVLSLLVHIWSLPVLSELHHLPFSATIKLPVRMTVNNCLTLSNILGATAVGLSKPKQL